jgi:hypothetical protein
LISPKKSAGILPSALWDASVCRIFISDLLTECRIHMSKEQRVVYLATAIIVLIIQLTLNRDKRAQTHTTFFTPLAYKSRHYW